MLHHIHQIVADSWCAVGLNSCLLLDESSPDENGE